MRLDEIQQWVPWEPYKEVAKPLPIIFGEITAVW